MSFAILGHPREGTSSSYRGIERFTPSIVDEFDFSHPVNRAFFQFIDIADRNLFVRDDALDTARQLVKYYAQLEPPQYYDLVEIAVGQSFPTMSSAVLLGYDLASGHRSLLESGLRIYRPISVNLDPDDMFIVIHPLIRLVQEYFQPQLNKSLLFDNYETATFCLECMAALQKILPNLFEDPSVNFQVIGVWLFPLE